MASIPDFEVSNRDTEIEPLNFHLLFDEEVKNMLAEQEALIVDQITQYDDIDLE